MKKEFIEAIPGFLVFIGVIAVMSLANLVVNSL